MTIIVWIGIAMCITQSAIFSGLNLAFFTVTKLRLEIEASKNNKCACIVLALRQDSNFLLVTILWGNVSVNVLLALLSGSVLTGVMAFLFSTVLITLVGEIMPQAYFSRNALKMASFLSPVIRFYQILLYPVAKPTALILDKWLGVEAITYFEEKDFRKLISMHVYSPETDIDRVEGRGALNYLAFNPYLHCHRPIIVRNKRIRLGETIPNLKVHPERSDDDVIDEDIILFWGDEKRVITGSDILGRLLRGIVYNEAIEVGTTNF